MENENKSIVRLSKNCKLDLEHGEVICGNTAKTLYEHEFRVIKYLYANKDHVRSLNQIFDYAWGTDEDNQEKNIEQCVRDCIKDLRAYHDDLAICIGTKRNRGYIFDTTKIPVSDQADGTPAAADTKSPAVPESVPVREPAIIPDSGTSEFTLQLIYEIFCGTEEGSRCWADSLRDLAPDKPELPQSCRDGCLYMERPAPEEFLRLILPKKILDEINKSYSADAILDGEFPDKFRWKICGCFTSDNNLTIREFVKLCMETIEKADANSVRICLQYLFTAIESRDSGTRYLRSVYQRCIGGGLHRAVSAVILYALLGEKCFRAIIREESDYTRLSENFK